MNKLIQMDEARFMNGPWEVAQREVAAALQITKDQARLVVDPKNDELDVQCDAAILELHEEGKTGYAIAKVLGLNANTVRSAIERLTDSSKMPFGQNCANPEGDPQSSPTVPFANTSDRPDTASNTIPSSP